METTWLAPQLHLNKSIRDDVAMSLVRAPQVTGVLLRSGPIMDMKRKELPKIGFSLKLEIAIELKIRHRALN